VVLHSGCGASLRWTDGGVRPYVIFGWPQQWVGASLRRTDEGVCPYVIRKLVAFIFFSIDKYKLST